MKSPRIRLTVFRLLLVIAILAILVHVATEPLKRRAKERYERCLVIASHHASLGAEYRRNSAGNPEMLRIAAWHEHMRREFERAARNPDSDNPRSQAFPPKGWVIPPEDVARR